VELGGSFQEYLVSPRERSGVTAAVERMWRLFSLCSRLKLPRILALSKGYISYSSISPLIWCARGPLSLKLNLNINLLKSSGTVDSLWLNRSADTSNLRSSLTVAGPYLLSCRASSRSRNNYLSYYNVTFGQDFQPYYGSLATL